MKTIDEVASFCKKNGFVYPSGDIYGGITGFYDFGPNGVELKNNIKEAWWNEFVKSREDVVGIDGSIITHPMTWKASGHVDNFTDPLVDCLKCKTRHRADHLIEDLLKIPADDLSAEKITELIQENKLKCPKCKGDLSAARKYNLMFKTTVGPVDDEASTAYLRPETAQLIFNNFSLVQRNARLKLPFGIAQIGKAFRNEISPRNFIFRLREFEQGEIEYFINEKDLNNCPYLTDKVLNYELIVYSKGMQTDKKKHEQMTIKEAIAKKIIKTKWHAYWLYEFHNFYVSNGVNKERIRIRQHLDEERSFYALDTWDIQYEFPFGWQEILGMANRTTYDLDQHSKYSGKEITYLDEETGTKVKPYVVAEPSMGIERAFFTFLWDAYEEEKERVVLKLNPKLAPIKCAILPLVKTDKELVAKARELFDELRKEFRCFYDASGSIGRRYRRMDEVGTPYCLTIDGDTLKEGTITLRDRDSMKQTRVNTKDIKRIISSLLKGE